MDELELENLLREVEQDDEELFSACESEEKAADALYDASMINDNQRIAKHTAQAIESVSKTHYVLASAIASLNQQTRLICDEVKEQRLLSSATHSELQKVLNVNNSLQNAITSTVEDYKRALREVVNKQDDELQQTTDRAIEHIKKSATVGGFLIVAFSCLGAILGLVGMFFTVEFGEFFRELWLTNPIVTVILSSVVIVLLSVCFVAMKKPVTSWLNSQPNADNNDSTS